MASDIEPLELAELLETAERPRRHQWSFRAALTRYAQPQPQRSSAIIELLRRTESALRSHAKTLAADGPGIWAAVRAESGASILTEESVLVELLRALVELDRLGDVLATWAVDRSAEVPDDVVDAFVVDVTDRLERLGVEREERPPRPPGGRRG